MATLGSGVKRKYVSSEKKKQFEVVERQEDDSDIEDEDIFTSIKNDDGDTSDDDEAVGTSDEEDDEVVYESDNGEDEGDPEDSGASSFEDTKEGVAEDDDDDNDDDEEDEDDDDDDEEEDDDSGSGYSGYGTDSVDDSEEKNEKGSKESSEEHSGDSDDEKYGGKSQSKLLNGKKSKKSSEEHSEDLEEGGGKNRRKLLKKGKESKKSSEEHTEDLKEDSGKSQSKVLQEKKMKSKKENNKDRSVGSSNKMVQMMIKKLELHNKKQLEAKQVQTKQDDVIHEGADDDDDGGGGGDEYTHDSSDEEDIRNTVGNIPMNWYDEYKHLGYDWEGKKIMKPEKADELDNFLNRMEDPNFWRTVRDKQTGQDVVLSEKDVEIIQRLQAQEIPDVNFDDAEPWIEWFSSEVMQTPIVRAPDSKRSFLPSKDEARKVAKMVHALKMGRMKLKAEKKPKGPNFYMLWETDHGVERMKRIRNHIPAPKRSLPGHAESYNPPREYVFNRRELDQWENLADTPWKRKLHFIPQKHSSLRLVPAYGRFIQERYQRCLDLYLCPRAIEMKLTIQPEDLLPQLPSPKDLQPFPTKMSMVYEGHTDMVRSIAVEPKGQYLISGSDDLTIRVWEIATGRCVRTIPVGGVVRYVSWCPSEALSLIAVAADRKVLLINPNVGDHLVCSKTDSLLKEAPSQVSEEVPEKIKAVIQWEQPNEELWKNGIRIIINHFKEVRQVTWHGKGDYFATVMPEGQNRSVLIHQLSKRRSQLPFSKSKGLVQCVLFHPYKPFFFVATQRCVRVYDLAKQEMVKKLLSNSKWISCMAIHRGGDNILVGTYDRKMLWFDLDLSTSPYRTLRLHGTAVRGVAYHKRYPLFASGSDDRNVVVSHGMVYKDLLKNPLIVPLKKLSHHKKYDDFGVFDVVFHPAQPWVFSSGADKTIRLYT